MNALDGKYSAHNCGQCILNVTEVVVYWAENICKGICVCGSFAKAVIELLEFFLCLLFVNEHLNYLLTVYHLFDVAVDSAYLLLLFLEVLTALAAYLSCKEENDKQHSDRYESELPAVVNHHYEHADNGNSRRNKA